MFGTLSRPMRPKAFISIHPDVMEIAGAPDVAFGDAEQYLPRLLEKRGKPSAEVPASVEYLRQIIEPVEREVYGLFETEARERLRGRDEDDWPVLATALGLSCAVWTEDTDFFGSGIAVWTTNNVEIFLKSQISPNRSSED